MPNNQEKILKHLMRFYANYLIDLLRDPHKWEPVYAVGDPESSLLVSKTYLERKIDYYKLDFIFANIEKRCCPTPVGDVLVPSLKIRLLHKHYIWTLAPWIHDEQLVCPNHSEPYKELRPCQHECVLGWILRDTHSPFIATPDGYRLNSKEGYEFEHGQLVMQLLEACTLRKMDDTPTAWNYIA
jgi:hypothetical protein